jgi:hypothetical protein
MVEGCRVGPPLAERVFDLGDGRTPELQLYVVPRRTRTVSGIGVGGLFIAAVRTVIATTVAQIDATDEGDLGLISTVQDDDLLVMTTGVAHAFVEQHLTSGIVHELDEPPVLLFAEVHPVDVRTPDQPSYVDAVPGEAFEHDGDFGPRAREPFVAVPPPVREEHAITSPQRRQAREQTPEIARAVDVHCDAVPARVRETVALAGIDARVRVAALRRSEEPAIEHLRVGHDVGGGSSGDVVHAPVVPRLERPDTRPRRSGAQRGKPPTRSPTRGRSIAGRQREGHADGLVARPGVAVEKPAQRFRHANGARLRRVGCQTLAVRVDRLDEQVDPPFVMLRSKRRACMRRLVRAQRVAFVPPFAEELPCPEADKLRDVDGPIDARSLEDRTEEFVHGRVAIERDHDVLKIVPSDDVVTQFVESMRPTSRIATLVGEPRSVRRHQHRCTRRP